MTIYLVRHAEAEKNPFDPERRLTELGKSKFRNTVHDWYKGNWTINNIFCSPYKRTVETAEIIKDIFGFNGEVIKDDMLLPGSSCENLINMANSFPGENIVFVGHQPDLSYHLANLIACSSANFSIHPGTVTAISFEKKVKAGAGCLEFMIPSNP